MAEGGLKQFFGADAARRLGGPIQRVWPVFDLEGYVKEVDEAVGELELKARVGVLAAGLHSRLPSDYPRAVRVLTDSLGEELTTDEGMFNEGWFLMPAARFVEEYGLHHPEESLDALAEITKRHTAEFAVRPFIDAHYSLTMARMAHWARDSNPHLRRAASESTRPRLPWARTLSRFVDDPTPVIEVLEPLRADPSAYVRKSVANNLNDIAKDSPDVVLETSRRWISQSPTPETTWIVRHALRTLIKRGNPDALEIVGVSGGASISVEDFQLAPGAVTLGESVTLSMVLINADSGPHKVVVDYVVHHVRANGLRGPKVFKLAVANLSPGERRVIRKTHHVRPITTRVYYSGTHAVDIQVNGVVAATGEFSLTV